MVFEKSTILNNLYWNIEINNNDLNTLLYWKIYMLKFYNRLRIIDSKIWNLLIKFSKV